MTGTEARTMAAFRPVRNETARKRWRAAGGNGIYVGLEETETGARQGGIRGVGMLAIIDYDAGNMKSVEKALLFLGEEAVITRNPEVILGADGVILPGVGAFGDAMDKLHTFGLDRVIRECVEKGIPFLGICLGLQLLFESSQESPGVEGLHILDGRIKRIPPKEGLKIPHIGWNDLQFPREGKLFKGVGDDARPYVYFVHSYYLEAADEGIVTATAEYGVHIHASVEKGNVFGCQFHPEKSSGVGMGILRNFIGVCKKSEG